MPRRIARINRAGGDGVYMTTALGRVVRERREKLGWSQEDLAARSNGEFSQNVISKIEIGERQRLGAQKLKALAGTLDLPVSALEDAQNREEKAVAEQLALDYATSRNPIADLAEIAPGRSKPNQATLVRMARVLAFGERMAFGAVRHPGDDD